MLNKLVGSLSCRWVNHQIRAVCATLFTIWLSACSVSPVSEQSDNQQLNSENNKTYVEAVSAMKSGNTKKAQVLLNKVIQQQPNFSNAHVNLSILYIKMKMYKQAETSLQQALRLEPDNIYALNQQGYLYRNKGEFSKAKESYEKAININSDYKNAHLNLGILYDLYLYDFEKAIEQYKIYQDLSKNEDKQVGKWIVDLERRNKKSLTKK